MFSFYKCNKIVGIFFCFCLLMFPILLVFYLFVMFAALCFYDSLHSLILCTIKQETFYKIICRTLLAPKHFPFAYISENEENYEGAIENYTVKFVNFFEGIFLMLSTELLFIWYNDCLLLLLLLHCFFVVFICF